MVSETRQVAIARTPAGTLAGRFSAMASPCEVLVDGADAEALRRLAGIAAAEAWRIEALWSRYRSDNVVHRINSAQGRPVRVDEETARMLDYADHLHAWSGGRLDLTSGVLRRVWKFDGSDRVPDAAAVAALLPLVGWDKVVWASPDLQLRPGMELDFGALGKEYAVDRALALVAAQTDRPVLVNFGGDLAASGPPAGAPSWTVGIDAGVPGVAAPLVRLARGGVATSGDAHRFLERGGVRYSHILDPRSGWPARGAPRAVTVAAASCTEAGVLATLAMLEGPAAGDFLRQCGADFNIVP